MTPIQTDMSIMTRLRSQTPATRWAAALTLLAFVCAPLPLVADEDRLTLGGYVEAQVEESVEEAVEESVEEAAEEVVEEAVEDIVEEQVADAVVDQIEEQVEEEAQLTLGGYVAAKVEEDVEEQVEEALEEEFAEAVEESIEEGVEESVAENVEEEIGEDIEASIEESIAENVEDTVQDSVEDAVESGVEESVAETVEEAVESDVEESVASTVEEEVEDSIEVAVEEEVEQNVEVAVEESVEENVESSVEVAVEESLTEGLESDLEGEIESAVEVATATSVEERIESEIDDIIEAIESNFEMDDKRIHRGQWLVMAEPEVFDELADEGYIFDAITDLPGMGMRLAEVAAPASFDISTARQGVFDVVGSGRVQVDLNHIYTAGTPDSTVSEGGTAPSDAIAFPEDTADMPLKIGMIDSSVDVAHPALANANIEARSFVASGADQPAFHGTAVASIIAANHDDYRGLAPSSELYAASVFEQDSERGEIASTVSLVRALDWLISSGVDAVNISLAGPPNRLLETALSRVAERDVMVLAAAGNGGPMASPMYPAAYESVVAVTAVDGQGKVFRLANRGEYLDLAAPGVNLRHARAGGGYAASSGTSFAVPFAATAAARLKQISAEEDVIAYLFDGATDLGPPGRDEIYGHGLISP